MMSRFYIDNATRNDVARSAGIAVLIAGGEIDYMAAPRLRERLIDAVSSGSRHVVLDLSAVTFIDSSAIGALVAAATSLRASGGGSVTVVCDEGNERVLRIFDIVGVASLIGLHSSWGRALSALDAMRALDAREAGGRGAPGVTERVSAESRQAPRSRSVVARSYENGSVAAVPAATGPTAEGIPAGGARRDDDHPRHVLDERA
jgi:anti-anti-sigma factor